MANSASRFSDIPTIGFGTWTLEGDQAVNAISWALEAGYRHIDTAQGYNNETEVGMAIRRSNLAPEEIFVTTKIKPEHFGAGRLVPSLKESLEKLDLDCVDLTLIHWPSPNGAVALEVYLDQFAQAKAEGLTRMLGVSNFPIALLEQAESVLGKGEIATNQVELHVFLQNRKLAAWCAEHDIVVSAYCPLARGEVAGDPVLEAIAADHGTSAAAVALAFLLAKGYVILPSSSKRDRVVSNFAAGGIDLDADEIARIEALDKGRRLVNSSTAPAWD